MRHRLYPHLRNLRQFYLRELTLIAGIIISLIYFVPDDLIAPFLVFVSLVLALEWIPSVLFVYMYYLKNRNHVYVIDPKGLSVIHKGRKTSVDKDDVERCVVYMSRNNPRFGVAMHPIDMFHYASICLKGEADIVITSICSDQVDEILERSWKGVPIEYDWGLPRLGKAVRKSTVR